MTTTPVVQVRRADHITLIAADLEATRHFYVDLLGLQQVPRPNFPFPGMWFQLGDVSIRYALLSSLLFCAAGALGFARASEPYARAVQPTGSA